MELGPVLAPVAAVHAEIAAMCCIFAGQVEAVVVLAPSRRSDRPRRIRTMHPSTICPVRRARAGDDSCI